MTVQFTSLEFARAHNSGGGGGAQSEYWPICYKVPKLPFLELKS